jgi:hypothetical protein
MRDIEQKISEEMLHALFEGKKVVIDYKGQPTITLYPPRYGVFITYEKYEKIVQQAQTAGTMFVVELLEQMRRDMEK